MEINKVVYEFTTPSHSDTKKNLIEFFLKLLISLFVTMIVAYIFIPRFFGIDLDEEFLKSKNGRRKTINFSWVDFYFALYLSLISMCVALVMIIIIIMTTKHPSDKLHRTEELNPD